tara:strand:- start:4056 stop:5420 length:1365 start_codon:yes stop_codon:yes gene_type:complete
MNDTIQNYLESISNEKDFIDIIILLLANIKTIIFFIVISLLLFFLYSNYYTSKSYTYKLELIEKQGISPKFDYDHLSILQEHGAIEKFHTVYIKRVIYSSYNIEQALSPIKSIIIEDIEKKYQSYDLFLIKFRNNIDVLYLKDPGIIEMKFISPLDYETIQNIFKQIIKFSDSEGIKHIFSKLNSKITNQTNELKRDTDIAKLIILDRINKLETRMELDKNLSLIDSDRRYAEIGKNLNIAKQLEIKSPIQNLAIVTKLMKNETVDLSKLNNTYLQKDSNIIKANDKAFALNLESKFSKLEKNSLLNSMLLDEYSGFPRQNSAESFMLGEDILEVLLSNESQFADEFATNKFNDKDAEIKFLKYLSPKQFTSNYSTRNYSLDRLKESYEEIYANYDFYLSDGGPFFFYDMTDIKSINNSTSSLKILIIFFILSFISACIWIIFHNEYKKKISKK